MFIARNNFILSFNKVNSSFLIGSKCSMDFKGRFSYGNQQGRSGGSQEERPESKQKYNTKVLNPYATIFYSTVQNPYSHRAPHVSIRRAYSKKQFQGSVLNNQRSDMMDFPQTIQTKFQNVSTLTRKELAVKEKLGSGFRQWQQVNRSRGQLNENAVTFKIMSYNVLAQDLLERHRNLYKDNAQSCLKWNFRFEKIYNEIKRHNCDILCLQEVQQNHLDSYYRKYLTQLGYNTILYKKRTGDCPDGCAIFYNSNLFTLIESQTVEFFQPNVNVLNKDNIGLIAKFAPIGYENCSFIVATTHLLYNPNRHDVRLAQIQLFLAEIDRVSFNVSHHVPVILTGDFNSVYHYAPVKLLLTGRCPFDNMQKNGPLPYQLGVTDNCQHVKLVAARRKKPYMSQEMQRKYVHLHHEDYPRTTENKKENNLLFNTGYLTHNFAFKSVYENPNDEATTYQNRWLTVDYIFYSGRSASQSANKNTFKEDKLVLLSRYALPFGAKLPSVTIPNENLGSDHLSLMAEFKLIL